MSDYPEHDKLMAHKREAQIVGDFLDWMDDQGWHFGVRGSSEYRLDPAPPMSKERIIGRFLDIDPDELNREKGAMLESLRRPAGVAVGAGDCDEGGGR